jgi:hypothetical protein
MTWRREDATLDDLLWFQELSPEDQLRICRLVEYTCAYNFTPATLTALYRLTYVRRK